MSRLAGGTSKAISEVKVGDMVVAADPATGRTEPKRVTEVHRNTDTDLSDVTTKDASGRTSVLVHNCDDGVLFRSMKPDGTSPAIEQTARGLGARPGTDIPIDAAGMVRPGTGGTSVSPGSPLKLPTFRRPAEFGGTGEGPGVVLEQV